MGSKPSSPFGRRKTRRSGGSNSNRRSTAFRTGSESPFGLPASPLSSPSSLCTTETSDSGDSTSDAESTSGTPRAAPALAPLAAAARKHVSRYDTQVVHNHGKIPEKVAGADGALAAGGGGLWSTGSTDDSKADNSMKVARRNFAESLKMVQRDEQPLMTLARTTHFSVPILRALQAVFDAISNADLADNLISAEELCRAIGTRKDSLLGRALFRLMDITRSGQINFRTWVTMLSRLSPEATKEEKIQFAFNLYDANGDGFIDRQDLISMFQSGIAKALGDVTDQEVATMIARVFELADRDHDQRINISDYRHLVLESSQFWDAFTIDVSAVLAQYNIISTEEMATRVEKLRDRDARQEEKLHAPASQARDRAFMEREEDDVQVVHDVEQLDID